jgi:hypothetical protein
MSISIDCRVGTKVPPRNDSYNIAFTGLQEDINFSRQIVRDFRSEFGRPHSNTFYLIKMKQHENNPKYEEIIKKLKIIAKKYSDKLDQKRDELDVWSYLNSDSMSLTEYIEKIKELILNKKFGNCSEMAKIIQYEHLKKGIETHNIKLKIFDVKTDEYLRDHVFSVRNLPVNADLTKPDTWGNAILVDSWCGSGIVEKAKGLKEKNKKDGLTQVLEFFCYDPKKETIMFKEFKDEITEKFINKMQYEKLQKRNSQIK